MSHDDTPLTILTDSDDPLFPTYETATEISSKLDYITELFISSSQLLSFTRQGFPPVDLTRLSTFFQLLPYNVNVDRASLQLVKKSILSLRRLKSCIIKLHSSVVIQIDLHKNNPQNILLFLSDQTNKLQIFFYKLSQQRDLYIQLIEHISKNTTDPPKPDVYLEPAYAIDWLVKLVNMYTSYISEEKISYMSFMSTLILHHKKLEFDDLQHLIYVCECMFGGTSIETVNSNFIHWMQQYYFSCTPAIRNVINFY